MSFLYVAFGGAVGSVLRYLLSLEISRRITSEFPYPIMIINITGCFVMGILSAVFYKSSLPQEIKLLMTAGIMGGFTTFSAFALDTFILIEKGQIITAISYVILSVALSLGGFALGYYSLRFI